MRPLLVANYSINLKYVAHTVMLLYMRDTQRKGDIANAKAISTFTAYGYDVSIPLTESALYDLVVDDGLKMYRVQAKYCSSKNQQVGLRRIHSNSKGYVVKRYLKDSYDWLYIYNSDGTEHLIKECLEGRNSIKPTHKDLLIHNIQLLVNNESNID